mmetsp:Transcript_8670/g.36138  ORF Transcript_8670/g.36138 Transcript_8670/m.36138 type:complete len:122 (-) Transcript_8670:127-492(-)
MARATSLLLIMAAAFVLAVSTLPASGQADVQGALRMVPLTANITSPTPTPSPSSMPSMTPSPTVTPTLKVNPTAQTWSFLGPAIAAGLAVLVIIAAVGFHLYTEFKKGKDIDAEVDFVVIQ